MMCALMCEHHIYLSYRHRCKLSRGADNACFSIVAAVVKREEDDDEDVEQKGTVEDVAALAIAAQPTGFTLATTTVQTEVCVVMALVAVSC